MFRRARQHHPAARRLEAAVRSRTSRREKTCASACRGSEGRTRGRNSRPGYPGSWTSARGRILRVGRYLRRSSRVAGHLRTRIVLRLAAGHWRRERRARPLDDLVELAAVQPHSAAGGAVVDFDALALGHLQHGLIMRTLHDLDCTGSTVGSGAPRSGVRPPAYPPGKSTIDCPVPRS
jgi:hypothetical protein